MLKRFIVSTVAVLATASAFAQVTTLTANNAATTSGPDSPATFRQRHFSFELKGSTTSPAFWTGSEISVDVTGTGPLGIGGGIWHASNQRDPDGDGNTPIGSDAANNNLFPPSNPQPGQANTARWDTYMIAPTASGGVADPQFAAPGGVVSTNTRIRGKNPSGAEIPLAWFQTAQVVLNAARLGVITFEAAAGDDLSLTQDAAHPFVYATLTGRTTTNANPAGTSFSFTIYQTPEPGTLALLALGGLAGLIRRR